MLALIMVGIVATIILAHNYTVPFGKPKIHEQRFAHASSEYFPRKSILEDQPEFLESFPREDPEIKESKKIEEIVRIC